MNFLEQIKNYNHNVFYDKWIYDTEQKRFCEIYLKNFDNPSEKTIRDTIYIIFDGFFVSENYHQIEPHTKVQFWFSKKSFADSINDAKIKGSINPEKKYQLKCKVTRISKYEMKIIEPELFETTD